MSKTYSVRELRDNLITVLMDLGLDKKLVANPSLASILVQFESVISSMNMGEKSSSVIAFQDDKTIKFKYSDTNSTYEMSISVLSDNSFKYLVEETKQPFRAVDGKEIRQKVISEGIAEVKIDGESTFEVHYGYLDDIDCKQNECNVSNSARKTVYDKSGIEIEKNFVSNNTYKQSFSMDNLPYTGSLGMAREALVPGSLSNSRYVYKEIVRRDKFDTARVSIDDRDRERKFNSVVELSGEHGYRNMYIAGNSFGPRTIQNLTTYQIEEMLNKETNPRVKEGLKEYAAGRDVYFYSSADDPYFVSEGYEQSRSK